MSTKRKSNWPTGTRQERGYGKEWQIVRAYVLERDNYLCQCSYCKADGRTTMANEVDHVVSRAKAKALGWSNEQTEHPNNLQAINSLCHERKTIEEKGHKVHPRIGLDGFPIA